jgi:uncharacterized membrane protein
MKVAQALSQTKVLPQRNQSKSFYFLEKARSPKKLIHIIVCMFLFLFLIDLQVANLEQEPICIVQLYTFMILS